MQSGILLCDIGNTTLKIGLANEDELIATYIFPSRRDSTADSLGMLIMAVLDHTGASAARIHLCLAASVVPALNAALSRAVARYLNCRLLFAPHDLPVPLANHYSIPTEVGADRLVGAFAARRAFPKSASLIVVDFGTAVTFDCVSGNAYMGGLIFPGPATAASALASNTAKLPHVSLETIPDAPTPGLDTATSIQHGLIFGYLCLSRGLCELLAAQLPQPVSIVATGAFAEYIGRLSPIFDAVLPNLILEGLRLLCKQETLSSGQL